MVKLIDIAEIRSGYSFREGIVGVENGNLPIIQFKDLKGLVFNDVSDCVHLSAEQIKTSHWLKIGEILLSNRGNYKAAVNCCRYPCVASGVFFVLALKDERFLPEYLAVFLNSQEGQRSLMMRHNASGVHSINRTELAQIDVPLLPLEIQKKIVDMYLLYEKEVDILEKIKKSRKRLVNSVLSRIVKEHIDG